MNSTATECKTEVIDFDFNAFDSYIKAVNREASRYEAKAIIKASNTFLNR